MLGVGAGVSTAIVETGTPDEWQLFLDSCLRTAAHALNLPVVTHGGAHGRADLVFPVV